MLQGSPLWFGPIFNLFHPYPVVMASAALQLCMHLFFTITHLPVALDGPKAKKRFSTLPRPYPPTLLSVGHPDPFL